MRKRWGKRGDEEIYYAIYAVIMTAIVVVSLFSFKDRFERAQVLDELFLSRDLALALDALFASPGAVQLAYDRAGLNAFSQLDYRFDGGRVAIGRSEQYPYARDLRFAPYRTVARDKPPGDLGAISKPAELFLSNSGWEVSILPQQPARQQALFRYPLVDGSQTQDIVVAFTDPLSVGEDSILRMFAGAPPVLAGLPDADMLIIVQFTEAKQVEALIPPATAARSRKLASLLVNRIIGSEDVPAAIRLSDDPRLARAREAAVLVRLPVTALAAPVRDGGSAAAVFEEYHSGGSP